MDPLKLEDDSCCFACGMDNPEGLRIRWKVDGMVMTGEYVPEKKYQGWSGIVHGGIIATLLDEAMTRLAGAVFGGAVTAEMTVRFVRPAKIGEVLYIKGEITGERKKIVELKAVVCDASDQVIAHSSGKAIKIER